MQSSPQGRAGRKGRAGGANDAEQRITAGIRATSLTKAFVFTSDEERANAAAL